MEDFECIIRTQILGSVNVALRYELWLPPTPPSDARNRRVLSHQCPNLACESLAQTLHSIGEVHTCSGTGHLSEKPKRRLNPYLVLFGTSIPMKNGLLKLEIISPSPP